MSTGSLFNVPTVVLLDQAKAVLDEFRSPSTADIRHYMREAGFDPDRLADDLRRAYERGHQLEAAQERAKQLVREEREEDRLAAEQGFQWIRRLHARLRLADAEGALDHVDVGRRFRFGHLPAARVRGVVYELRILMPLVHQLGDSLADYGVDAAFRREGDLRLAAVVRDRAETIDAQAERERLTEAVREAEAELVRLLRRIRSIRQIVSLDSGRELRGFALGKLRRYVGRPPAEPVADDADDADDAQPVPPYDEPTEDLD